MGFGDKDLDKVLSDFGKAADEASSVLQDLEGGSFKGKSQDIGYALDPLIHSLAFITSFIADKGATEGQKTLWKDFKSSAISAAENLTRELQWKLEEEGEDEAAEKAARSRQEQLRKAASDASAAEAAKWDFSKDIVYQLNPETDEIGGPRNAI